MPEHGIFPRLMVTHHLSSFLKELCRNKRLENLMLASSGEQACSRGTLPIWGSEIGIESGIQQIRTDFLSLFT